MGHRFRSVMTASTFVTALAASAASFAMTASADAENEKTVWRLFVADQADPTITAFDLGTDAHWTFTLSGPARLHATPSGEGIVAVQSDNDAVHILKTGVALSQHGDHADIAISEPLKADAIIEGPRPFHVIAHNGHIAINFDRGGYASIYDEHDLLEGNLKGEVFKQNRAHHGFSVPMGDVIVSSVASDEPVEEGKLPPRVGIAAHTKDGEMIGEMQTCTDLHGEAFSGSFLATGCREGVAIAEETAGGVRFAMLPYPAEFPKGKTGTLWGAKSVQMFLGTYDGQSLLVIDPAGKPHFTRVELPFRHVTMVLDPARPQHAFVLTEDGALHRFNMLRAEIEASANVTEPYSMDGHWRDPRPRLAMAGDNVVLTDPRASLVRVVDKANLEETTAIQVEGTPYNIIAVGGSGLAHSEEASHNHNHDHSDEDIYSGKFKDSQIKDRALLDWAGDWQSVFPYLQDGTLDPVMAHKAKTGSQSAQEYKSYYTVGYRTDVDRITIEGDTVAFYRGGEPTSSRYAYDGLEILTYESGARGVRYIFKKTEEDNDAPKYIQFSDHKIAPGKAGHYHLYWGDDRAALLEELTNWPTYYPSSLSPQDIVAEMVAH